MGENRSYLDKLSFKKANKKFKNIKILFYRELNSILEYVRVYNFEEKLKIIF